MLYADIILPFPLQQYFTYIVPAELCEQVVTGIRVIVPFGKSRFYTGIVAALYENQSVNSQIELKSIVSVVDTAPVISEYQLKFWQWMASYYMCSPGEVMRAALPAGLKLESESFVVANDEFEGVDEFSEQESTVYGFIQSKKRITLEDVYKSVKIPRIVGVVKKLYEQKAIFIDEKIVEKYQPKQLTYVKPCNTDATFEQTMGMLSKWPKQQQLYERLLQLIDTTGSDVDTGVSQKLLLESEGLSSSVLKSLEKKGLLSVYSRELSRFKELTNENETLVELSEAQKVAKSAIEKHFEDKNIVLLHGITSSGKTEIYFHLIQQVLEQGKQVLYLLPEIAITSQMINRMQRYFKNRVGVFHSKYSDSERVEVWKRLMENNAEGIQIILGVRSSVFLPFQNLGLVIVDEEHENTYKQNDPAPRYHARDAAMVLAQMYNAKVLLGSATPSVESYFHATAGKYGLVNLNERFSGLELPKVELVNLRLAKKKGNTTSHFSNRLMQAIDETIADQRQVILFQNRRGFSPYLQCSCGWIPRCKHCDVTLTYYKNQNKLVCHYCNFVTNVPAKCGECSGTDIKTMGLGTEKVEDELKLMFPQYRVSRMDLDSTRGKHAHEHIIADFENGNVDILVGTQMVTKGLDFQHVGLVGILNADSLLNYPDFRAYERSFQLMQQVSGRAGRKGKQGLVVIQTYSPGNPEIRFVFNNDYLAHYHFQITERKEFLYPPYTRIINFMLKHVDEKLAWDAANALVKLLKQKLGNRVAGPARPLIGRIQNQYIVGIVVKLERTLDLAKIKLEISRIIAVSMADFKAVRVTIDVDPM
jgi:primosomal protein N' (replication factor Y)